MEKITKIEVPVVYYGQDKWLVLNHLGNSGKLRAVTISKSDKFMILILIIVMKLVLNPVLDIIRRNGKLIKFQ